MVDHPQSIFTREPAVFQPEVVTAMAAAFKAVSEKFPERSSDEIANRIMTAARAGVSDPEALTQIAIGDN